MNITSRSSIRQIKEASRQIRQKIDLTIKRDPVIQASEIAELKMMDRSADEIETRCAMLLNREVRNENQRCRG